MSEFYLSVHHFMSENERKEIRDMANNKCIVLGGSFNPPTIAHKLLMEHALKETGATYGVFVPSSHNYVTRKMSKVHPGANLLFSEQDRLKMLNTITISMPGIVTVSDIEYGDDGRGHTFDTMRRLKKKDSSKEYYFLLGADKLKILPRWHNIERFLEEFQFVVTSRSQDNAKALINKNPVLSMHSDKFLLIPELEGIEDISSTHARVLLKSGDYDNAVTQLNLDVLNICKKVLNKEK